jgi:hypothetical protein
MQKSKVKNQNANKKKEIPQKKQIALPPYVYDLLVIAAFIVLLLFLFSSMVFKGNIYPAGDVLETMSKSHMVNEYYKSSGQVALWNPYPLAGIPNVFYLPGSLFSLGFWLGKISDVLSIPFVFFLIGVAGLYFLLRYLKFSLLISCIGSLAFILVPYFSTLVYVGHSTKLQAVMYIPWILLTFLVFLDKLKLLSLALFVLFFSLQFQTMHFQIAFYTGLLLLFIGVPFLWSEIKKKNFLVFLKKSLLLITALFFVILIAAYPLFLAKKLSEHSLRATPGINIHQDIFSLIAEDGVDLKEINKWSLKPKELITFIIPGASGGTSDEKYTGDEFPSLKDQKLPLYWGNMDFSQGYDTYFGILLFFLALFAMVNWRNKLVLGLAATGLLFILWSLGLSFRPFYMFCYDHLPYFRNFRSPTTGLAVVFFIFAVLSAYGLQAITRQKSDGASFFKSSFFIYTVFFVIVGVLIYVAGHYFKFLKPGQDLDSETVTRLQSIRKEMYFSDLGRYFTFLLVFAGVTFCYFKNYVKLNVWVVGVLILVTVDFAGVRFRYDEKTETSTAIRQTYFPKTSMIDFFEGDPGNYRVYPLVPNRELLTYYMRTIGDYDMQMNSTVNDLYFNCLFPDTVNKNEINWNVIKMMNVKYVILANGITDPRFELKHVDKERNNYVYLYKDHLSSGYFVNEYKVIPDDIDRLRTINSTTFDPAKTALLEREPAEQMEKPDSCFSNQTKVLPDQLSFDVYTNKQALFVISEVYFPEGWKIYMDDKPVNNVYKTDHAFQSLAVPAGDHKIRMEFRPAVYKTSRMISSVSSIFLYLVILVLLSRSNLLPLHKPS